MTGPLRSAIHNDCGKFEIRSAANRPFADVAPYFRYVPGGDIGLLTAVAVEFSELGQTCSNSLRLLPRTPY